MQLRKLIRETLQKQFGSIMEAAHTLAGLPENFLIYTGEQQGRKQVAIFELEYSELYKLSHPVIKASCILGRNSNGYVVEGIAAEKGFGPLMYEVAMMDVYPESLSPTKKMDQIKQTAYSIWEKFHFQRSDVEKIKIEKDSPDYSQQAEEQFGPDSRENQVINCRYYKKPSPEFTNKVRLASKFVETNPVFNAKDFLKKAGSYFGAKYRDVSAFGSNMKDKSL